MNITRSDKYGAVFYEVLFVCFLKTALSNIAFPSENYDAIPHKKQT